VDKRIGACCEKERGAEEEKTKVTPTERYPISRQNGDRESAENAKKKITREKGPGLNGWVTRQNRFSEVDVQRRLNAIEGPWPVWRKGEDPRVPTDAWERVGKKIHK